MSDLDEIVKKPSYDAAASDASKSTIFVFIATFSYLVFFSGASPGFLGGAAFFVVGIFAVSLAISMPLFLLKSKFPKVAILTSIIDIVVTIFLTRAIYLWLFSQPAVAVEFEPRSFLCTEPLPEFTLSETSNPTDAQLDQLCSCIYAELEASESETSKAIAERRESDVSQADIQRFIPKFGAALERCGGNEM